MKYIDADRLRAEIERAKDYAAKEIETRHNLNEIEHFRGVLSAYYEVGAFLDSLQQEQPMDIPSAGSGAMGTTPPKVKLDVKPTQPGLEQIIHDKVVKLRIAPCYDELRDFALYFYDLGRKDKEDK